MISIILEDTVYDMTEFVTDQYKLGVSKDKIGSILALAELINQHPDEIMAKKVYFDVQVDEFLEEKE